MYWASIGAAISLFSVLVTGALATTAKSLTAPEDLVFWTVAHRHAGEGAGTLAILVFIWIAVKRAKLRAVAWALTAGVIAQALLGLLPLDSSLAGAAHAILAQVLFAGSVGLAVALSPGWFRDPQIIQDYGWPSLRSLAISLPVLILIQIALGAAFRQRVLGLMPHVIGAMLVSMFILMVGAFVLQQCKDHKTLSGTGRALMVTTFVQVFLGLAIFTFRSLSQREPGMILAMATAHVATGALLLAVCVVMGMHIRRNVIPKAT